MSETILVTGASGLLGANLVLLARQRHEHVVALCYPSVLDFSGVQVIQANLTDKKVVKELIQAVRPKWIVHCAALTNVDWCESHRDETWQVNVDMTQSLAVAARDTGASFVYISTDSVFDGKSGDYSEISAPAPLNVYAESKLAGERVVNAEWENSLIVRTNIYGWNAGDKTSLAEWILSRITVGQPVPGFHDVVFTPILVNDLSEVILDMLELGLIGTYHVAGSQACSKYEFAIQLADVFCLDKQLVQPASIADAVLHAPRPRNTSLQTTKVSHALGRAMPDIRSGLEHLRALQDRGHVGKLKSLRRLQNG